MATPTMQTERFLYLCYQSDMGPTILLNLTLLNSLTIFFTSINTNKRSRRRKKKHYITSYTFFHVTLKTQLAHTTHAQVNLVVLRFLLFVKLQCHT